jgi:hypothetical protein
MNKSLKNGAYWLEEHEEQAKIAMIPNYILILTSIFALIFFKNENKTSKILNIVVLVFCFIGLGLNIWVGNSGGKIRHQEFRDDFKNIMIQK